MSHPRKSSHVRALGVWVLSLIFGACEAIAASSSSNLAANEVLNLKEHFLVTQADAGEVNEQGDQSRAGITTGFTITQTAAGEVIG